VGEIWDYESTVISTANFSSVSRLTQFNIDSCVAEITIFGATSASYACFHRLAHRHHLSPGLSPGKLYSGIGVDKSFPIVLEKAKKDSVATMQMVCSPPSDGNNSHSPFRENPVVGCMQQTRSGFPYIFLGISVMPLG
jgi:hypothetical protein